MDIEKVKDKIRKLLALGTNAGATEAERERALAQANKFLLKYNLDMPTTDAERDELAEHGIIRVAIYMSPFTRRIAQGIASLYFCEYLVIKGAKDPHCFIGTTINRETAAVIFELVVKGIFKEVRLRYTDNKQKTAFSYGAAGVIYTRCAELRAQNEQMTTHGNALVLYDTQKQLNQDYISKTFGSLGTTKGRQPKHFDREAYVRGQQYGQGVGLTRNIDG